MGRAIERWARAHCGEGRHARPVQTKLEEDSRDHFGGQVCLFAAHRLSHGRVVLDRGAYAYDEGLVADAPDDKLGVVVFLGVRAAGHCFVAGGGEGRAFGRAVGEVGGKLFGDVGHEADGDAEYVDGGAVLDGEHTEAGALIVEFDAESFVVAAEDAACGGFIEPWTFDLGMARGGRQQRDGDENEGKSSHRFQSAILSRRRSGSSFIAA